MPFHQEMPSESDIHCSLLLYIYRYKAVLYRQVQSEITWTGPAETNSAKSKPYLHFHHSQQKLQNPNPQTQICERRQVGWYTVNKGYVKHVNLDGCEELHIMVDTDMYKQAHRSAFFSFSRTYRDTHTQAHKHVTPDTCIWSHRKACIWIIVGFVFWLTALTVK